MTMTNTMLASAGSMPDPTAMALAQAAKERKLDSLLTLANEIEACMVDLDAVHRELIDNVEPEFVSAAAVTWDGIAGDLFRAELALTQSGIDDPKADVVQSYASLSAALDTVNAEIAELEL